jgi:hypothetical protein
MEGKKSLVETICETVVFGGYLLFIYKLFRKIL